VSLENGIFQELKNNTEVGSLVGGRIFGSRFPTNTAKPTLPAIVYHTFWSDTVRALDGPDGLRTKKLQIDCYGDKYPDAVEVADAVRGLFEGFKGTLTNGVVVQSATVERDEDFPAEPGNPTQGFVYRRRLEVTFRYIES
jgi:hypothetical protein